MILVITGKGKGKTTSAIGTAIRNAGWGNKTAIVFFDKGGNHYGEQIFFDSMLVTSQASMPANIRTWGADPNLSTVPKYGIDAFRFGNPRFNEKENKFRFENN